SDDVKLRHGFAVALAGLLDAFLDRHLVAARLVDLSRPGAECAVHPAEVGGVQVAVDIVEGEIAVTRLPDLVREAPETEKIAGRKERDPVFEGEPLSREDLSSKGF